MGVKVGRRNVPANGFARWRMHAAKGCALGHREKSESCDRFICNRCSSLYLYLCLMSISTFNPLKSTIMQTRRQRHLAAHNVIFAARRAKETSVAAGSLSLKGLALAVPRFCWLTLPSQMYTAEGYSLVYHVHVASKIFCTSTAGRRDGEDEDEDIVVREVKSKDISSE